MWWEIYSSWAHCSATSEEEADEEDWAPGAEEEEAEEEALSAAAATCIFGGASLYLANEICGRISIQIVKRRGECAGFSNSCFFQNNIFVQRQGRRGGEAVGPRGGVVLNARKLGT